ncbi:MAG: chemotaxis-specific protein-glutamate methyltransferase CheB [Phycisphaera sp.]|nr:chemotaxis-specific protein-glutamate methyltransferase CheB [Phycisphaera sp.]
MRVVVVDDSAFMRRAVKQMLESDGDIEVVASARNGREGVELVEKLKPDLVTLDIEMPEMDGLTALRHIMRKCPTQVMMLSSLTTEGSHAALTALKLGAADFLAKDMSQVSLSVTNIQDELVQKARQLGGAGNRRFTKAVKPTATRFDQPPIFRSGQFDVVCIGSSTGGPPVLETILCPLPASMSAPVVVAQHMPEIFTRSMTERLGRECPMPVVHVEDNMPLQPRTIHICPGGKHTHITKIGLAKYVLRVNNEPTHAVYKPSVDALFSSAATSTASRTLGIVLTGIGDDGLRGSRDLLQAKGTILAQSEETCVVYGMPKAVTENGLVAASLTPEQIAQSLVTLGKSASAA